jgi:uncharacterized RDD family membrane protein YckC
VAIGAYVALLAGVGLAFGDADTLAPFLARPATAHAIGFLTLTLPVLLYFAAFESSAARATPGKRLLGIFVAAADGNRLGFLRALSRSVLKFLPWELSHTLLWRIPRGAGADASLPSWIVAGFAVVWLLVLAYLAGLFRGPTHRTLYDRLTGTVVLRVGPLEDPSSPAPPGVDSDAHSSDDVLPRAD